MKRIAVFTTNWLGDALFLFPFFAALKINFPESHLTVISLSRINSIFGNSPHVDKAIIYHEKGKDRGFFARLGFIAKLSRESFDTAFIIKPSLSRTLMLKLAGIKQVIGFSDCKNSWLLTVKAPAPKGAVHKIDYFLGMLEFIGLKINQRRYEFFPSDDDKNYIRGLFQDMKIDSNLPLVVINPGANWYPKRWLPENFVELIKRIKEKSLVNIAITGADKDKDLAAGIIRQSGDRLINLAGKTTFGQLGALMQEAGIIISADSGPMHIAAAVGKKVIALFGPTSAQITGPYPPKDHIIIQKDIGCKVPCYDANCQDYRCMKAISVEEILEKVVSFKL
ncbi:MAG: lipopolysaccharide heptosyltransferase II [Candidatus Omnitrophota bacterium]